MDEVWDDKKFGNELWCVISYFRGRIDNYEICKLCVNIYVYD